MYVEKKISFTDVEPTLLFGPQDMYLKQIEEAFPDCSFTARGTTLTLKGNKQDAARVETITSNMRAFINKNGDMNSQDVEDIIRSAGTNRNSDALFQDDIILINRTQIIRAKTLGQRQLVSATAASDIAFAIGPAGTGKTYVGVAIAVAAFKEKRIQKIVLARPAIEAGESLGFLPGELSQKVEPYLRPLYDALEEMLPPEKLKDCLEKKIIEVVPLAYMRGRTFTNAFILLDEAQNATSLQMKMFLTRLGQNSKSIVMGDISQIDLPHSQKSGLVEATELFTNIKGISFTFFEKSDIVRHRLVREIVRSYETKHSNHNGAATRT